MRSHNPSSSTLTLMARPYPHARRTGSDPDVRFPPDRAASRCDHHRMAPRPATLTDPADDTRNDEVANDETLADHPLAGFELDDDARFRAMTTRDPRFDGWFFIGVRTTGIYCRP